jgi:hypothetical protein
MRDTEPFSTVDKGSVLRRKFLGINLHPNQTTLKLTEPNDLKLKYQAVPQSTLGVKELLTSLPIYTI